MSQPIWGTCITISMQISESSRIAFFSTNAPDNICSGKSQVKNYAVIPLALDLLVFTLVLGEKNLACEI